LKTIIKLKNPKKILNALAAAPMTKWELSQKTEMEYPRVHEAISLLEKNRYVTVLNTLRSQRGRDMKLYGYTFKGVIAYLASIPNAEKQPRQELEKLTKTLETYGEILDYALFKEVRWLINHYGSHILEALVDTAKLVEDLQPFPTGAMRVLTQTEKQAADLKKRKWKLLKQPKHQEKLTFTILEDGKPVKTVVHDPLAEVTEEIEDAEQQLEILRRHESNWWSMSFAARIAERLQIRQGKGDLHNKELYRFFKQTAEFFRTLQVEPAEKTAQTFKDSTA
jgi:hypothetical protein